MCPVQTVTHVSGRSLKKISCLERSFRAEFCFPARLGETGEAWGKQQKEYGSGRAATFGICMASNVPSRVEQSDGTTESRICFLDCFPSLFSEGTDIFIQFPQQPDVSANETQRGSELSRCS